ncbi:ParA family protein [Acutalibacter intestini]|uniref:ParA family protein n=1 Tax=Acutalibacter intestini TaxID=3093659 RepID=UPI00345F40B6
MRSINALFAANEILIPMRPHSLSLKGMEQLMRDIGRVKRQINPGVAIHALFVLVYSHITPILFCISGMNIKTKRNFIFYLYLRQHRTILSTVLRSQIFRQRVQIERRPSHKLCAMTENVQAIRCLEWCGVAIITLIVFQAHDMPSNGKPEMQHDRCLYLFFHNFALLLSVIP